MEKRSFAERIEELEQKKEKAQKKATQYDGQLKRLRKQEVDEQRKQRTHKLIVCGAELAALYDRVLELDEVLAVVNFLREQQRLGIFSLENGNLEEEQQRQENEKTRDLDDGSIFNGMFNF